MASVPFSAPNFQLLSHSAEVADFREKCWTAFTKNGLPTRKQEAWKYTDLSRLVTTDDYSDTYSPSASPIAESHGYTLHFIDGWLDAEHSSLPNGVSLQSFAGWQNQHPEQALEQLARIDYQQHTMAEANAALMTDGLVLTVAANQAISDPITVHYHCTQAQSAQHYRHLVVLEDNAQMTLIEQSSDHSNAWLNSVMHVNLGKQSKLQHIQMFCHTPQLAWLSNTHVWQQAHSEYHYFALAKGVQLARSDVQVYLQEPHAKCLLDGVYQLDGNSHFDIHTRVDHLADDTYSDELFKGIVSDQARGVFNGKAIAHQDTKRIQAYQRNHNLLLHPNAHVDTKPELEIYTDDIRCTHGATVGQLDEAAIFYLRSRGIDEITAIRLLKDAFLHEGFSRLHTPLKTYLLGEIAK